MRVGLPGDVFTQAGADVKTNQIFAYQGRSPQLIWYYDLSDLKVIKHKPLTLEHLEDFFTRLSDRDDSALNWTLDMAARNAQADAEAKPFHDQTREKRQAAARWKERLRKRKMYKE